MSELSAEEKQRFLEQGRPRALAYHTLDHFVGRRVGAVEGESPNWVIRLEGGIIISNKEPELVQVPVTLIGKTLLTVILGEQETRLRFGISGPNGITDDEWLTLNPTRYTLGGIEGQMAEYYPQMPKELESALPRDPSPERAVEAPEKPQDGDDDADDGE